MDEDTVKNGLAMTGNAQGFELPRGCLMTSGVLLLPVVTLLIGSLRANTLQDAALVVVISTFPLAAYALAQKIMRPRQI